MIRSLRAWCFQGVRLVVAPLVAVLIVAGTASAQTRFSYSSGQPLEPAYEGWMPNTDGSFTMYFGYQNTNWVQEFDIAIGPDNDFSPGNADMGQPTHFYPRRNPFLFTIQVPKDFGNKELVWTLTANGVTRKAFGSLKTDYLIDPQVISTEVGGENGSLSNDLRTNIAPDLSVEGPKTRTVKVGQPLSLIAIAGDPDNLPPRRDGKLQPGVKKSARPEAQPRPGAPANSPAVVYRPPVAVVASAGPGLHLSWIVYRGKATNVKFTPGPDEDVERHPRVRQLDVVAAVRYPGAAGRRQVDGGRGVQRAWHVRAARRRQRRVTVHLRQRHGHGHAVNIVAEC